jgi:prevent-host-death family protein
MEGAMRTVNIHTAKTHLSQLLADVAAGEEIVIAKAGKPMAKLVPLPGEPLRRKAGVLRDKVWIDPTWDPVASDPDIVRLFEESDWLPNEPLEGAESTDERANRK